MDFTPARRNSVFGVNTAFVDRGLSENDDETENGKSAGIGSDITSAVSKMSRKMMDFMIYKSDG